MHNFFDVYDLFDVLVPTGNNAVHMDKDPPPPILRTKNKLDFSCTLLLLISAFLILCPQNSIRGHLVFALFLTILNYKISTYRLHNCYAYSTHHPFYYLEEMAYCDLECDFYTLYSSFVLCR